MGGYGLKEVVTRLNFSEGSCLYSCRSLNTPEDAVEVISDALKEHDREVVIAVNLDTYLRPMNWYLVAAGGLTGAAFPVREVFKTAILANAAKVMLFHNHPGGSVKPSREDMDFTRNAANAGRVLGIPLVDHIIVAGYTGEQSSMYELHPEMFA